MRFSVRVDASQVRKRIGPKAAQAAAAAAIAAMVRGALRVERTAKKNVGKGGHGLAYGELRASIHRTGVLLLSAARRIFGILVGTNKRHGVFVEFGTGPIASEAQLTDEAREFMREIGYAPGGRGGWPPAEAMERWLVRKKIPQEAMFPIQRAIFRRGTRAYPFLFPALESERASIVKEIGQAVGQQMERGA